MTPGRAASAALTGLLLATALGPTGVAAERSGSDVAVADPLAGRFGGPFSLIDQTGRRVSEVDFEGRFLLVYFGFTHCVDVCPLDLAVQHRALLDLGPDAERIQPLFITVDPARDTPEVLAAYLEDFHPATLGLTGTEQEIAAVAAAYRVHRRAVALTHPHAEHLKGIAGDYIIDHGSLTFLMGPDGTFRTLVPHSTSADRLTALLADYLARDE